MSTMQKIALSLLLAALHCSSLAAQTYPSKPIRLIVPYAAGGPVDGVARLIAEGANTTLGQTMVVDNKPGAGGNLGVDLLAKSPADGYTLVMGAVATHAINPALAQRGGAKVNYDPLKDFAPIALAASIPNVLIVNKAFAAQHNISQFADFIRVLKTKPGRFDMASGGTGSAGHLAGELLKSQAGVYAVHVPYSGAAPAVASLLAGQTQFMFDNLASANAQIKAGTVLALAVTTAQRSASLPTLPSVAEAGATMGLRNFDVSTWFGVFAPSGTPAGVVAALNQSVRSTLGNASNTERLKTMGSEVAKLDATAFAAYVVSEHAKYAAAVKLANIQLN
jgi:tripartite-type tricarboxylate transporter receptor subunit TctC